MKWLETFRKFPPRAKAASFTIDQVVGEMMPRLICNHIERAHSSNLLSTEVIAKYLRTA